MRLKKLGIIGGTGFNGFESLPLKDESWQTTPYGETSATIDTLEYAGRSFYFLARHGRPHQIPPHKVNYRANVFAFKEMGVEAIIAINAVGAISKTLKTPQMVVPHQIIDLTHGREHTYSDGSGLVELQHVDFTFPYDQEIRQNIISCAQHLNHEVETNAVYACTQGPRLESAAEIDYLETIGAHIVGMTAMPEAALARELKLPYVNLCLVVNPAAGRSEKIIEMPDIKAAFEQGMVEVRATLQAFIKNYCEAD